MQWSDQGIVLGARAHGESSVILELMTREHGRHLGLVHGGRSRRMAPVLQPGNGVAVTWRARLDEHIGHFAVEADTLRSARLLGSPMALYGIGTLALHLRLLPERDPHPGLYAAALFLLDHLDEAALAPALFIRFELMLLAELGYGLDLSTCAATGRTEDLVYVSPRSGRAVSREAGAPYRDRLLPLPGFLRGEAELPHPDEAEIAAGFRLTGFFLESHVWGPQGRTAPDERARFVAQAASATRNKPGSAMVPPDLPADSVRDRA
ncbi:DNA repair protein RecO [Enterovirga aerilata]|uniref:DNA repair protein RecO n=1 Tax=Enterovirga aerilata TaxID=2730920 RepID=A0A849I3G2_9HYPH|nr:DNA repair protein RecO [Enterovirga sp. DB1703]